MATLLLSTGVPMITAGDELGRTQRGNNNAYCQDNEISWLDWDLEPWKVDLLEFTRLLLALRREHPALRHKHFFDGRPSLPGGVKDLTWFGPHGSELTEREWWEPAARTVGMYVSGSALKSRTPRGEPLLDTSFLLLLHAGPDDIAFTLPGRPWAGAFRPLLDTADERPGAGAAVLTIGSQVHLGARSVTLLEAMA